MEQIDCSTRNNHINRNEEMGPQRSKLIAAGIMRENSTARRIQDWVSGSALIGLGGYMALSVRD